MDKELQQQVMNGDAISLCSWMQKQPPHRLRTVLAGQMLPSNSLLSCKGTANANTAIRGLQYLHLQTAGHDINAKVDLKPFRRKRFGTTPLLLAIQSKKPRLVEALVAAEADVNSSESSGFTPLHWLVLSSSLISSVAEILIQAGADISLFSLEAQPLLHLAVDEGRLDIVQFALLHGCDVNVSYAYDVIKEEHWARVASRYHVGDVQKETKLLTALSRAVGMRKIRVLQYLLRLQNARVSLDDLHLCILEGDMRVACMLISHVDDQTLGNDFINGQGALLSLGRSAFFSNDDEDLSAFTIQLLLRYVSCGWDISNLYWAGAVLGKVEDIDQNVRSWISLSEDHEDFSRSLMDFLDWYIQETSEPPTLFGLCSRRSACSSERSSCRQLGNTSGCCTKHLSESELFELFINFNYSSSGATVKKSSVQLIA